MPGKAVVIGGGPAGLEAARVLAARGHDVVLFEADTAAGGQVRLAAFAGPRRRDLIGIVDWRVAEARREGADLRFGVFAEVPDVLAEHPGVVIVATGGLPDRSFLESGQDLVADTWDILGRSVSPARKVMIYDDNGGYPGMDATEFLALAGAAVEYVTPERRLAPDVGSMNSPPYLEVFTERAVSQTTGCSWRASRRFPSLVKAARPRRERVDLPQRQQLGVNVDDPPGQEGENLTALLVESQHPRRVVNTRAEDAEQGP